MDEDIRTPDKAFMDTLYSNTTNAKPTRRRRNKNAPVIKNTNTFYQSYDNHYKHHNEDDNENENEEDLKLAEEQLLQHVINISLKDTHINTILYTKVEEDNSQEELRTIQLQKRQLLFTHSLTQIYRLNIIDKTEQLYQNILSYITSFIQSGENIHISIQEKENITTCLNHIRLTQSDRQHILDIFHI